MLQHACLFKSQTICSVNKIKIHRKTYALKGFRSPLTLYYLLKFKLLIFYKFGIPHRIAIGIFNFNNIGPWLKSTHVF